MESSEAIIRELQQIARTIAVESATFSIPKIREIANVLRCQSEVIEQLERELTELRENAIIPKYKSGDTVWFINHDKTIQQGEVWNILNSTSKGVYRYESSSRLLYEIIYGNAGQNIRQENDKTLFATREEAQASLKKGE
jgi:hypothetical protein